MSGFNELNKREISHAGFYGEKEPWYSGSTVVQKLHVKYSSEYAFPKGILLLREPYEAIVSFVQYLEAGHLGSASPSTFKHESELCNIFCRIV